MSYIYIFHHYSSLTIRQSELLQIIVCFKFGRRTLGDTQGNGVDPPVNYINIARVEEENIPDRKKKTQYQCSCAKKRCFYSFYNLPPEITNCPLEQNTRIWTSQCQLGLFSPGK